MNEPKDTPEVVSEFVEEWRGIVERQANSKTFWVCFEDCVEMLSAYDAAIKENKWLWEQRNEFNVKHQEAEAKVQRLHGALEKVTTFAEQLCEDVGVSKHQPSIENARQALNPTTAINPSDSECAGER